MTQKERFNTMAEEYDRYGPLMVPDYDGIQELIARLIAALAPGAAGRPLRILDLGAGSGRLIERLRSRLECRCIWQDYSDEFRQVAERRLGLEAVEFVSSDLSETGWAGAISPGFDAVISMSCIHHLRHERKKALYREINELLLPSGMFINADEVRGESDTTYLMWLNAWDAHVQRLIAARRISDKMEDIWKSYVERNITNFPDPAPKDIHASLYDQMTWLRASGFVEVECYWKSGLWAVFGGRRTAS